ncbi:MAG: type II toxin-antitoxin system RelE/ParE family toxin [Salibacteraceae bacterium]
MVKAKYVVLWDEQAKEGPKEICKQIKKDAPEAAKKVQRSVLAKTRELSIKAEVYQKDGFKASNTGAYRAFEHYSCRVTYKIEGAQIRILRVRHARQNPLDY